MKDSSPSQRTGWLGNLRLKLVSLVLAAISWFAIHQAINLETVVEDVPVTILHDENWAVLERSTDTVDIRFRGAQEDIRSLRPDNVKVILDIRGKAEAGETRVAIKSRSVKAPRGARPVEVRPGLLDFRLDEKGEQLLPVKPDLQGSPPPGYERVKVTTDPAAVLISGPRRRIAELEHIRSVPIELQGRQQTFKARVGLVSPSPIWVARMEPDKVTVEVEIVERSSSVTLEEVAVRTMMVLPSAPEVEVHPPSVSVQLKGQSEIVEDIEEDAIRAYVDCSGLDPAARYELPVLVHTPERITVEKIEPATVIVEVGSP